MERNNPFSDKHPPIFSYCLGTSSGQRFSKLEDYCLKEKRTHLRTQAFKTCHWVDIKKFIDLSPEETPPINDPNPDFDDHTLLHHLIRQDQLQVIKIFMKEENGTPLNFNVFNKKRETPLLSLYNLSIKTVLNKNFFQSLWYWISPRGRKHRKMIDSLISLSTLNHAPLHDLNHYVKVKTIENKIAILKELKGLKGWIHKILIKKRIKDFVLFSIVDKKKNLDSSEDFQWLDCVFQLGSVSIFEYLLDNGLSLHLNKEEQKKCVQQIFKSNKLEMFHCFWKETGLDFDLNDVQYENGDSLIHMVVQNQNVEMGKILVENGLNINKINAKSENVFHEAVRSENLEMIHYLIEAGVDVNQMAIDKRAIEYAIESENLNVIRCILTYAQDLDFNLQHLDGTIPSSLLYQAVQKKNLPMFQLFVEHNPDVNFHNQDRFLLGDAVKQGSLEIVRYLIENHSAGFYGKTHSESHLSLAYENRRWNILKYFIDTGSANINAVEQFLDWTDFIGNVDMLKDYVENCFNIKFRDKNGNTLLHVAVQRGDLEVIDYCINQGLHINDENKEGLTSIDIILKFDQLDVMKHLIEKKCFNIQLRDKNGNTLLHKAVQRGNLEVIDYCINQGLPLNHKNKEGLTPIDIIFRFNQFDVMKHLIEKKCFNIELRDKNGNTLLHKAVQRGNLDLIDYCINQGLPLKHKNKEGLTPIDIIFRFNQFDVMKHLIEKKHIHLDQDELAKLWMIKKLISIKRALQVEGIQTSLDVAMSKDNMEILQPFVELSS